ncbi:antichymotrypsin-2-like [Planococcus citri]|uniref:antichymotrypsin-2-like n=1 Tax=Planococcus citri TaxID=170843 RepID=UPI0031F7BBA7
MISQKAIILLLFFVLGTKRILVESAPTSIEEDRSRNIERYVAKFNTLFSKFIHDDLKPGENMLFSPLNIYTTLALLHLGSNGETKRELSDALGIPASDAGSTAHQDLGKILNDLQTSNGAEVRIANSVFVQKGLKLKDSYLQDTRNYYKNEAQQVDFKKGGSEATNIVNNWASINTKNRIPQLFKSEIPSETSLLLASALFFNASWQEPFGTWATKDEKFNTGAKQTTVKMMHSKEYVPYMNIEQLGIEAISLPYKNNEFSMAVFLPYENKSVNVFVDGLNTEIQQLITREFSSKRNFVEYKIPRFKFDWKRNINALVMKSGIKKIFKNAELHEMIENSEYLKVSEISHAAEIQVDESGTMASAISYGVEVLMAKHDPEPIKFYVDRPFAFWIYHHKSGIVLFTGIVQNPTV